MSRLDLIDRHASLKRAVRAMETRANPYWRDSFLGRTGEWESITVLTPWTKSFDFSWRIVGDVVFFQGTINNVATPSGTPAFILPKEAWPDTDVWMPTLGTSIGFIKVQAADGHAYPQNIGIGNQHLASLRYPTSDNIFP